MSSNHGRLCRDGIVCDLEVNSKLVIDRNANICGNDIKSTGNIKTNFIVERTPGHGVVLLSDLCVASDKKLLVDTVSAKTGPCITFENDVCIDSGHVLRVDSTQVVTAQQPPIGNAIDSGGNLNVVNRINDILNALRTHGLIANPP